MRWFGYLRHSRWQGWEKQVGDIQCHYLSPPQVSYPITKDSPTKMLFTASICEGGNELETIISGKASSDGKNVK